MKRNLLRTLGLAATASLTVHGAYCAETADTLSVDLNTVNVVANRAGAKTPVAFTNVTKAELDRRNDGRDITYLLQSTPSVTLTSDAGAGIGYTSMRIRGTDDTRINITANGIPINDPESHKVFWVNMPDLASSLRDVQIQRGAGTSTNGAGAFGGSVNMLTDAPSEDSYAEISGAYGSYNSNRQSIRVGSGLLGDHWSFDARISHIGSDGYIERASSKLWSYFGQAAYQNGGTSLRLLAFGGKERTYMAWDYASLDQMKEFGRRYNPCGEYTNDRGERAYYPDQYDNFVQHHFQLLFSQRLGRSFTLTAALHYTYDDGYYDQYKTNRSLVEYGLTPFTGADGATVKKSDLIRLKFNRNDFGGGQFALNYLRERWNVTFGASATGFVGRHFGQVKWVRNYVGPIDPLQEYYRNYGHKFDMNYYLRANYDIDRRFSVFADLQYHFVRYTIDGTSDNWDDAIDGHPLLDVYRKWNFFNPKLGVNFEEGNHRAFASWSVAHKEPVRDNFTDGDPKMYPRAERLDDFEAGYTYTEKTWSVGVNLYYMLYKDQLVATGQLSDTGNALTVNVPDSYRAGVELQGAWRPARWFDWAINMTLSRNRIKNFVEYVYEDEWTNPISVDHGSTPIAFSPDVIVNNAFNFHVAGLDASLSTNYVSRQYLNNAKSRDCSLAGRCVTDLSLAYTLRDVVGVKAIRLGVTVYNLFNKKYFNNGYSGAGYSVVDGRPEIYHYAGFAASAPTHVMATVNLSF